MADGLRADVIIANNVLAHVPDPNGFVGGIELLCKKNARAYIEVPYLMDLLSGTQFDTIYHEHVCYFSVTALETLFRRNGLMIESIKRIPVHGGSLFLTLTRPGEGEQQPMVEDMMSREAEWGIYQPTAYRTFGESIERLKCALKSLLISIRGSGQRVAAYGAAAKGTMLLNIFGITNDLVEYVVDRSPHKQGHIIPGTKQPICSPSLLLEDCPDYLLILAWNFAEEIMSQQKAYAEKGGRFIIPIPELCVMGGE